MSVLAVDLDLLDLILDWQMTIAWAGEANCEPSRLGWWRTDLIDDLGGGDLLARLLPRTKVYAGWESARQAAIATDRRARQRMANPDKLRTIFFWGFDLDEKLHDRLAARKRLSENLKLPLAWEDGFDREAIAKQISDRCGESKYELVAGGREIRRSDSDQQNLLFLVAALVPFDQNYSMPFYRIA
jgi:hypothetical protein